jgi:hypothetical protein
VIKPTEPVGPAGGGPKSSISITGFERVLEIIPVLTIESISEMVKIALSPADIVPALDIVAKPILFCPLTALLPGVVIDPLLVIVRFAPLLVSVITFVVGVEIVMSAEDNLLVLIRKKKEAVIIKYANFNTSLF